MHPFFHGPSVFLLSHDIYHLIIGPLSHIHVLFLDLWIPDFFFGPGIIWLLLLLSPKQSHYPSSFI